MLCEWEIKEEKRMDEVCHAVMEFLFESPYISFTIKETGRKHDSMTDSRRGEPTRGMGVWDSVVGGPALPESTRFINVNCMHFIQRENEECKQLTSF